MDRMNKDILSEWILTNKASKIIIIISHNDSFLSLCDNIYEFNEDAGTKKRYVLQKLQNDH